jgi:hypothetical protein
MPRLASRRAILLGIPALVIAGGVASAAWTMRVPTDLDLSRQKTTGGGHYIASILPEQEPVSVGLMHAWLVTLTDREGSPVDGARITIDGGMPQHGHGLPTLPQVTGDLGNGRYYIDGVKFNMQGWWELKLGIDGPAGSDAVTFNIVL